MDISAVKSSMDIASFGYTAQTTSHSQSVVNVPTENNGGVVDKSLTSPTDGIVKKKSSDLQEVTEMTEAMNKFVQAMNSNIRFTIHEKSHDLMVQVIDPSTNTVLKEFPSSEFLDTMAAIRDYVGILLDKRI